ncbi:hypothetical protein D3C86_1131440 [compost metagenome]
MALFIAHVMQQFGQLFQRPVAGIVPQRVIDLLEMVDVENGDGAALVIAVDDIHQRPRALEEGAAIGQTGEVVSFGQLAQAFKLLQRLDIVIDAALQFFRHERAVDEIRGARLQEACRKQPVGGGRYADHPQIFG